MVVSEILNALRIADLAMAMIMNYRVDMVKFNLMRDKARGDGRRLSDEELLELASDARRAGVELEIALGLDETQPTP